MSRGVRDLRDLICVSRLSVRESDDEDVFSSDENVSVAKKGVSRLSLISDVTDSKCSSPTNQVSNSGVVSPDSGFATNGSPGTSNSVDSLSNGDSTFITSLQEKIPEPLQPGTARFKSQKKKRRKKSGELPLEPSRHPLPKPQPLPPVPSVPGSPMVSESELSSSQLSFKRIMSSKSRHSRVDFDDMMMYLDATLVASWLTRANSALESMSSFCCKGDNFVQFSHFWLSEFPDIQKRDIFGMEYDILIEELTFAFAVGKENRSVVRRDILDLLCAVFKEYPVKLLSARGNHIFLDYLDILISEKQDQYKKLLSDVKCSTSNRQFAQWLLAIRSFALVNVWSSIINFYRNLVSDARTNPMHDTWVSDESLPMRRMFQAINLGHIEVIHYLIVNGHVNPTHTDSHNRSLIFLSVMHNQLAVTKYLMKRVHPAIDVNLQADSGNTVLHAAANSGNFEMVEILCENESIDTNSENPQCENATPLHLAVMHGHTRIVECLLKHGGEPGLRMGQMTLHDLARDFEHEEILEILENAMRN